MEFCIDDHVRVEGLGEGFGDWTHIIELRDSCAVVASDHGEQEVPIINLILVSPACRRVRSKGPPIMKCTLLSHQASIKIEDTSGPTESVYCSYCQLWCNGVTQWLDHQQSKKHSKWVRHWRMRDTSAGSGV